MKKRWMAMLLVLGLVLTMLPILPVEALTLTERYSIVISTLKKEYPNNQAIANGLAGFWENDKYSPAKGIAFASASGDSENKTTVKTTIDGTTYNGIQCYCYATNYVPKKLVGFCMEGGNGTSYDFVGELFNGTVLWKTTLAAIKNDLVYGTVIHLVDSTEKNQHSILYLCDTEDGNGFYYLEANYDGANSIRIGYADYSTGTETKTSSSNFKTVTGYRVPYLSKITPVYSSNAFDQAAEENKYENVINILRETYPDHPEIASGFVGFYEQDKYSPAKGIAFVSASGDSESQDTANDGYWTTIDGKTYNCMECMCYAESYVPEKIYYCDMYPSEGHKGVCYTYSGRFEDGSTTLADLKGKLVYCTPIRIKLASGYDHSILYLCDRGEDSFYFLDANVDLKNGIRLGVATYSSGILQGHVGSKSYSSTVSYVYYYLTPFLEKFSPVYSCAHTGTDVSIVRSTGDVHYTVTECVTCGTTISSVQAACFTYDDNMQCDICGDTISCTHELTQSEYVSNGDMTHTYADSCHCGQNVDIGTEDCSDTDGDYLCDGCKAELCRHANIAVSYKSSDDGNHTVTQTCNDCSETVSEETEACIDANKDKTCDACSAEYSCKHKNTVTNYTVIESSGTHTKTEICSDCDAILSSQLESCTDYGEVGLAGGEHMDGYCDNCNGTPILGSCGDGVMWSLHGDGCLTIYGDGAMEDYSTVRDDIILMSGAIGSQWNGLGMINKIIIKDGVTYIGEAAFYNCCYLGEVTIASSVTAVGENAFYGCDSLTNVYYGGTQTDWGKISIYDNNDSLVSATLYAQCEHKETTLSIKKNYDGTHIRAERCDECSEILSTETENCFDSNQDNQCDLCRGEISVIEKVDVAGSNMNLGNELQVNFIVDKLPEGREYTAYVKQETDDAEGVLHEIPMEQWTDFDSTHSRISVRVRAMEMTDALTLQIVDEEGNLWSDKYSTSVRNYAAKALAADTATDKMKTLVVDMLNYGAAAQENFGYKTDDPANILLSEEQASLATSNVECSNNQIKGNHNLGSNLALDDCILLNMFFEGLSGKDMSAITAKVTFTNWKDETKEVVIPGTKFEPYGSTGDRYKVKIDDIVLADASCLVTVEIYEGDETEPFAYGADSVESYAKRGASTAAAPLYNAIMRFATSAKAYLLSRQ
ncbi:MAG: leucine-rich repeat protein [Oscillospiraceae bacterium]|nr:leucine-rich repeat protein [Oscillospiraceae bacterium]